MSVCAAGTQSQLTQSVPVVWGKLWGNWFGRVVRWSNSIVIAEGTDGGLLFCPRFRHSYLISSRSDLSHIFSFFSKLAIALDQIGHDNSVRARCCVLLLARGAPSAVPSDVEQKTQAQPQFNSRAQ